MTYRVYMDVCCLNRPFDDHRQDRVRLESEAVLSIISRCILKEWILVSSYVVEVEIMRIANTEKRQKVITLMSIANVKVLVSESIKSRTQEFIGSGMKLFDAAHVSCAEAAQVNAFLTTDDRLVRQAMNCAKINVLNPVQWLFETQQDEGKDDDPK